MQQPGDLQKRGPRGDALVDWAKGVMSGQPPAPPPMRIRLGHTGIEWNVGDPMPTEAKNAILAEKLVWGAILGGFVVGALALGAVAIFGG